MRNLILLFAGICLGIIVEFCDQSDLGAKINGTETQTINVSTFYKSDFIEQNKSLNMSQGVYGGNIAFEQRSIINIGFYVDHYKTNESAILISGGNWSILKDSVKIVSSFPIDSIKIYWVY